MCVCLLFVFCSWCFLWCSLIDYQIMIIIRYIRDKRTTQGKNIEPVCFDFSQGEAFEMGEHIFLARALRGS